MNAFRITFPQSHVFLAVVHTESAEQALRNARVAANEGADGIFMINHSIPYGKLVECHEEVRSALPDFWIGLNCLDLGRVAIHSIPQGCKGLWTDNAGITESRFPVLHAASFDGIRKNRGWCGLYFGGIAFKHQPPVNDLRITTQRAIPFMDVITTSGEGTGIAADLSKIRTMKAAAGIHPLAIASGITPENVREYMPHADCFLVATGISSSETELDPALVRKLAEAIRG